MNRKLRERVRCLFSSALVTVALLTAANPTWAQGPRARGGEGETRLGKLEFEGDYVTEETAAKLREELRFQAAVQTYLWGFPIANVMGLRDGHRAVGIKNTSIPIFEDYLTPKTVVPTGNQSTIYAYNVVTLDEPMVLVVPPDVVGFISDAWQRPQGDLGRPGPDKGKGGKFLLVPPGYKGKLPSTGYYVVPCATKNILWLVRAFVKDGDTKATVQNLKQTKLYPLSNPNAPQEYLNASKKPAYCIPPRGYAFWELLAKALNEETVQVHDRVMMGMASIFGLEKGKPFKPDPETRAMLVEAEKVVFAMNATLSFESVAPTAIAYDDRNWEFCFQTQSPSFDAEHRLELYERAAFTHQAMTGANAMVLKLRGKGSKYIFTSRDADGSHLNGSNSYTLKLPANVPAKDFWSVCVYDTKTRSILDTGRPMSAVNSYMDLPVNADGSIDVYFGPTPPPREPRRPSSG
ncbi:MAG: DUF1254 domain-containing protein [Planctomycetota bacterium]|jgi:hypothetical protein